MKAALLPQRSVPRGNVLAAAMLYRRDARARILRAWRPGDVVHRAEGGFVLVLAAPRLVRAEEAEAAPLVVHGDVLDGTLRRPARGAPGRKPGPAPLPSVWRWMEGGREVVGPPGPVTDPAEWVDLALPVARLAPLGHPPPAARAVPGPRPIAEIFGMKAAPERAEALTALAKAAPLPAWQERLLRWFALATVPLARAVPQPPPPGEPARTAAQRLGQGLAAFEHALAAAVDRLGMAWIFQNRHVAYLEKLMAMFDEGRLEDALKWALPLNGTPGTGDALPAWFPPSPRAGLQVSGGGTGPGRRLGLSDAAFARLEQAYRRAIDRLVAEGRIEWAAFALAELLGKVDEAILLLEKHARYDLAAEIAERRQLPPARVVRLWFLAGEHERAVALARRAGCWHEALSQAQPGAERRALAATWCADLVRRGELSTAVDVAWKHDLRDASREWVRALLASDEAGRHLPRWSALGETDDATIRLERAAEADPERALGLWEREELWPEHDRAPRLAGPAVRHALAAGADLGTVGWLLARAQDPVLAEDLRRISRNVTARAWVPRVHVARGPARILDVAPCGDGVLLAHGEAGVTWLNRAGKVAWRVAVPADRLVSGPDGTALAAARRGTWWSFHRLELHRRTARRWVDLELLLFADRFDGGCFLVAAGTELLALDPSAEDARHFWRFPFETAPIPGIAATIRELRVPVAPSALVVRATRLDAYTVDEHLTWRLPDLRLQHRRPGTTPPGPELDAVGAWTLERTEEAEVLLKGPMQARITAGSRAGAPLVARLSTDAAWIAGDGGVGRLDLQTGAWWTVAPG